jgi:hypothetical protein
MEYQFEEPTPYMLNSLDVTSARKNKLEACVDFETTASKGTALDLHASAD